VSFSAPPIKILARLRRLPDGGLMVVTYSNILLLSTEFWDKLMKEPPN
jgi:hypothetical protein